MATFTQLLAKKRSERLGKQNDVQEILSHSWFDDLDSSSLLEKKYVAPFIPNITDQLEKPKQRAIHSFVPEHEKELIMGQKDVFEAFGAYIESESSGDEDSNQ